MAGEIVWTDLTVPNAELVRDFYSAVVGWQPEEHDMGGYADYVMNGPDGFATGVCWRKGLNENVPAAWLVYITVDSLDASIQACTERGGKLIDGPRPVGDGIMAIIEDPAGAVCALIETPEAAPTP